MIGTACRTHHPDLMAGRTYYYPADYPFQWSLRIGTEGDVSFNYYITSNALECIQVDCSGRQTSVGQRVVSGDDLKIHVATYDGHTLRTNTVTQTNEVERQSNQKLKATGEPAP
jgi:hypothetical protein